MTPEESLPRTVFAGTGFYVPDRIVTNEELTHLMDTTEEWIVERTGIRERRWVSEGMSGAEMARDPESRAGTSRCSSETERVPPSTTSRWVGTTLAWTEKRY